MNAHDGVEQYDVFVVGGRNDAGVMVWLGRHGLVTHPNDASMHPHAAGAAEQIERTQRWGKDTTRGIAWTVVPAKMVNRFDGNGWQIEPETPSLTVDTMLDAIADYVDHARAGEDVPDTLDDLLADLAAWVTAWPAFQNPEA